jgi:hypothetical protein
MTRIFRGYCLNYDFNMIILIFMIRIRFATNRTRMTRIFRIFADFKIANIFFDEIISAIKKIITKKINQNYLTHTMIAQISREISAKFSQKYLL